MHIILCQGWLGWAWAVVVSSFTGTGCAYLERDLAEWLDGGDQRV